MTQTQSLAKIPARHGGSVTLSDILLLAHANLKLLNTSTSADGLTKISSYVLVSGAVDQDLIVQVKHQADKPGAKERKIRKSVKLTTPVIETDDVAETETDLGDAEGWMAFNTPFESKLAGSDIADLMFAVFFLLFDGVTGGYPNLGIIDSMAYGVTEVY